MESRQWKDNTESAQKRFVNGKDFWSAMHKHGDDA